MNRYGIPWLVQMSDFRTVIRFIITNSFPNRVFVAVRYLDTTRVRSIDLS